MLHQEVVDCQLGFCGECGAAGDDALCCEEGRCNDAGSKFVLPAVWIGESTGRFFSRLCEKCLHSSRASTAQTRSRVWLLLAGGGWILMHGNALSCAGGEQPHPSSSCSAVDALQQVEDIRVAAWRSQHRLEADEDFAFHFVDFDQALTTAGRIVAGAWLDARHAAMGGMLQKSVERAIQDVHSQSEHVA